MRTHRAATLTLTAVVGFGALVGSAAPAFAAPKPANGTVIVQPEHQGPVQGPKDVIPVTTTTTVQPKGPGDLTVPAHVNPPADPKGPGDIVLPGGHGDPQPCGPKAGLCGPGDIAQPDPDPCDKPICGPGDIGLPTPCDDIARTNEAGNPCPTDPCPPAHPGPRSNEAGDPCRPDPCDPPLTHGGQRDDCGGTTGGDKLPHTGADVAMELGAGLGLTGLGALLVRATRRKRTTTTA